MRRPPLGALLVLALAGCEPMDGDALVVATSWPAADRQRIERDWKGPIRWMILSPGDDLEGLASRHRPPDVLLGGPIRSYDRLARFGLIGADDRAVARRATIRSGSDGDRHPLAFCDPRSDPVSLAWAEGQLRDGSGYARLVRVAATLGRIGRRPASPPLPDDRGEIALDVGIHPGGNDPVPWVEGVAVLSGGAHREAATRLVKRLAGPTPAAAPDDLDLVADLLGATLVDAQDELWAAWAMLERSGPAPDQRRWMTEPPPWPPASVAKYLNSEGETGMAMVETLAGHLADDPGARAWLLSSWLTPPRPVDRSLLREIARAADGRLAADPQFRDWLRAEWTDWARQRYRRVRRVLESRRSGASHRSTMGPDAVS